MKQCKSTSFISGSGYLTACMAEMVGKSGKVVGIEHIPELVEQSKRNMKRGNADLLESGQVIFVTGDGRQGYENGTQRVSLSVKNRQWLVKHTVMVTLLKPQDT